MVAVPAWVFDTFLYCPFVLSKISFGCRLMVALPARVFYSFMYCPFLFSKMPLWICFMVALYARVFFSIPSCTALHEVLCHIIPNTIPCIVFTSIEFSKTNIYTWMIWLDGRIACKVWLLHAPIFMSSKTFLCSCLIVALHGYWTLSCTAILCWTNVLWM